MFGQSGRRSLQPKGTLKSYTARVPSGNYTDGEQTYKLRVFAYENSEGNLYFLPEDCSWDKHGNLVIENKTIRRIIESTREK